MFIVAFSREVGSNFSVLTSAAASDRNKSDEHPVTSTSLAAPAPVTSNRIVQDPSTLRIAAPEGYRTSPCETGVTSDVMRTAKGRGELSLVWAKAVAVGITLAASRPRSADDSFMTTT